MTEVGFRKQIDRLQERFGKQVYTGEFVRLLWREVHAADDHTFESMVDKFIGECRQAPLLPEFREALAKKREGAWLAEKARRAEDAKAYWGGTFWGWALQEFNASGTESEAIQNLIKIYGLAHVETKLREEGDKQMIPPRAET